eukprot:801637-Rhodomonas_salina.2
MEIARLRTMSYVEDYDVTDYDVCWYYSVESKPLAYTLIAYQQQMLKECCGTMRLPHTKSWEEAACIDITYNEFSRIQHILTPAQATNINLQDSMIMHDICQKYKKLLAMVTRKRQICGGANAEFIHCVNTWHAWYISECIRTFSRYPHRTDTCFDTHRGCGLYTWELFRAATVYDIEMFVRNEPRINPIIRDWNVATAYGTLSERAMACHRVRAEMCECYIEAVHDKMIKRIRIFEKSVTGLKCHKLDTGMFFVDNLYFHTHMKNELGMRLFFTCNHRACCTTLCSHGLRRWMNVVRRDVIKNIRDLPFKFTRDCPHQAEFMIAIYMGTHPRLGSESPFNSMPDDVIAKITHNMYFSHKHSGMNIIAREIHRREPSVKMANYKKMTKGNTQATHASIRASHGEIRENEGAC